MTDDDQIDPDVVRAIRRMRPGSSVKAQARLDAVVRFCREVKLMDTETLKRDANCLRPESPLRPIILQELRRRAAASLLRRDLT